MTPLKEGDKVALVAPSGPPEEPKVKQAVALLRSWGLDPVLGKNVLAKHPRAKYLAGSDKQRATDIHDAWMDPEIRAVFCIRGGFGTVRLLDLFDTATLRTAEPKPLIGSSDITGLHELWADELGLATWFAPMLATGAVLTNANSAAALKHALFNPHHGLVINHPDARSLVPGIAEGVLTGGNMSLLAMTTGSHPGDRRRSAGKIVLLEDITEELYRLDGMLMNLLRSGYFDGAAGVALGTWEDCGPIDEVIALMSEALSPLGIPLVHGLRFGHGNDVASIPLGVPATLFADESPKIVIS